MRIERRNKNSSSASRVRVLFDCYRDIVRKFFFGKDNSQSMIPTPCFSWSGRVIDRVLVAVDEAMVEGVDDPEKLKLLKEALTKKMSFSGTKVQIKPNFKDSHLEKLQL